MNAMKPDMRKYIYICMGQISLTLLSFHDNLNLISKLFATYILNRVLSQPVKTYPHQNRTDERSVFRQQMDTKTGQNLK